MQKLKIGIVGGGASGMMAAIAAADAGGNVTILEKKERIGKKILATGNGKCNFSNLYFDEGCYYGGSPEKIRAILEKFPMEKTRIFLEKLGLMTKEKNGGLYPVCEQASAVLDVLRFGLKYRKVTVFTGVQVEAVYTGKNPENREGFYVILNENGGAGKELFFDRLILSCGGPAGIKDGGMDGFRLAEKMGHTIIPLAPALVQLRCKESFFKALFGVRTQALVRIPENTGTLILEQGELQFTDYGISGIPVFQLSRHVSRLLQKKKEVRAELDFLPFLEKDVWKKTWEERKKILSAYTAEEFLTGTIHKKIGMVLLKEAGISPASLIREIPAKRLEELFLFMKCFPVTVTGTKPFENAQVCAGGVNLSEVDDTLQSKKQQGLYLTGELLDVDGRCGGYNLQWAWSSGHVAGEAAAKP